MRHLDRLAVMIVVLVAIFATSTYAQSNRIRLDLNIRGRHGSSHLGYDVGRSGNSSHFGVRYSGPHASFSYSTSRYENDFDRFLRQRELNRIMMERQQMFGSQFGSKNYGCLPTIDHLYNSPSVGYKGGYGLEMPPGVVDWIVDAYTGDLRPLYIDGTVGQPLGCIQTGVSTFRIPATSALPSRPSDLGRTTQPMPSGISDTAFVEVINEFDCDVRVEFTDPFPGGQTREWVRVTRNSAKQVEIASGQYTVIVYGYAPDRQLLGQKLYAVAAGNNRVSARYLAN